VRAASLSGQPAAGPSEGAQSAAGDPSTPILRSPIDDETALAAAARTSKRLGLTELPRFRVERELLHVVAVFRVMAPDGSVPCTIRTELGEQVQANAWRAPGAFPPHGGVHTDLHRPPMHFSVWSLWDATDSRCASLILQQGKFSALATLTDVNSTPAIVLHAERQTLPEFWSLGTLPSGLPLFKAHGSLLARTYPLEAPTGAELAVVHEDVASGRAAYSIEISTRASPLGPLVLTFMLRKLKLGYPPALTSAR